jgi:SAM-dependent methyltransferase
VAPGLHRVLEIPRAFDLWQRLGGGHQSKRQFIDEYVRPSPCDSVLDLGCGTGALRALMSDEVSYLGVEIDLDYVAAARKRFRDNSEFICSDLASVVLPTGRTFTLAIAYGVFHHLDDGTARRAVDLAADALDPEGRFVIDEPCWAPGQGRLETFLLRLDRGKFVRTVDEYKALLLTRFQNVNALVVRNLYRVPYTMVVLEGRPRSRS